MRLGLRLKADVITFLFLQYTFGNYQLNSSYLYGACSCCVWFYQLLSWYSAPLGCRLDVSRLDTSIPKKELVSRPPGGSLDWDLDLHTASATKC
jgi:nitrate reductase NapE component